MDTDYRRKQLDVDDEDGLLLLQEEFIRAQANSQPAAKATRVVRKTAEACTAANEPATAVLHVPVAADPKTPAESLQHLQISERSVLTVDDAAQHDSVTQQTAAVQQPTKQQGSPQQQTVLHEPDTTADAAVAADEAEQQPMCPSIPGILTEVREREAAAVAAPAPPPTAAAFPAAVHRKQSKFALGRRQQQQQQQPGSAPATSHQQAAAPSAASRAPAGQSDTAAGAAAAVRPETAGIHESNLARLAGMSTDEVEEAQAELAARFSPAALQFLKNRRKKAAVQGQQQQQQGEVQQQQVQPQQRQQQGEVQQQEKQEQQQQQQQQDEGQQQQKVQSVTSAAGTSSLRPADAPAPAGSFRRGFLGGKAAAQKPAKQQQLQQQQPGMAPAVAPTAGKQQRQRAAAQEGDHLSTATIQQPLSTAGAMVATGAGAKQDTFESLPPVARLRFSLDGQVIELADPKAPPTPDEEVLMRDNISRAAGTVPQGYTLPETRVLVRSSHAPQRAAGFRMMAVVLRRAQPSVLHLGLDGQLVPQEVLLDSQQQHQQQQQQQQQEGGPDGADPASGSSRSTGVMWYQVWEYALVALRAVMLCRIGLDDDNGQVLSAASDVLCVLLGRSSSELLIDEVAAASAAVSWPVGLRVSLRRLDHAGVWDQVMGLVKAAAASQQGLMPAESAGDADVDTPEDLAAVDPLAGFMATDPLPRIRFLLQNRADSTECVIPLLSVLEAIAASSSAAAEGVVRCKGMPEALLGLLGLPIGRNAAAVGSIEGQRQQAVSSSSSSSGHGGFRVGALRLLRLLCAASPLATQLLRTAGLDSVVQLLLCTSGAAAAGSGANSSSDVEQQLLLLEALRIWRVSALHGVSFAHMDLMFQFVAGLLQPPPAAAAVDSNGSSNGCHASSKSQLQWQLTAEAYQLVDTLLRHALAVSNGSKTLGSEMITPGCAAAIAQEAAAAWIQNPKVLQEVAQGLVSLADCSLRHPLDPNCSSAGLSTAESASSSAAWFRALPGMHPSLLVPQGFAVLAGFAAVLQCLSSYWASLQSVPKQLAGELLSQLDALGLAGSSSSSVGDCSSDDNSHSGLASAAATATHASGTLATVLLSVPVESGAQQQQKWQQQLGAAILQHCLQLMAASKGGCSSSSSRGRQQAILADYALGAAAAATLLPICQLQQQLQKLTQQQQQRQDSPHLATQAVNVVTNNMLSWVAASSRTLVIEPWKLAQYTMRHYQIRLLLLLAKPLLHQQQQQQQQEGGAMQIVNGLLCVLPLLGPGHEADALQALQLLFESQAVQPGTGLNVLPDQAVQQQPVVAPLLAAAAEAVHELLQQGGSLAAAAAGVRGDGLAGEGDISQLPYPPRILASPAAAATNPANSTSNSASSTSSSSTPGGVSTDDWCKVLLEGYAVTWLSIIAQQDGSSSNGINQQGSSSSPKPSVSLPRVYVTEVEGSRLPVPPEWLMAEILALPQQPPGGSSGQQQQQQQQSVHPVSAALLLALGLERLGGSSSSCMKAVRAPWKLEALLNLLYLYNAAELLPAKGAAAGSGLSWQQPDARWAAAVLTQQYVDDIIHNRYTAAAVAAVEAVAATAASPGDLPVEAMLHLKQQQQQRSLLFPSWAAASAGSQLVDRLVSDLADISLGDPLFSCHVALLLLLPAAGVKLQRAVWGSLAHQACLHLLPKLNRCIGGSRAYLGVQLSENPGDQATTGPEEVTGSTSMFDIHFVGDMAKSLAQGDLHKALKMSSLSGYVALHGIAAVALDQDAWKDHDGSSSSKGVSSAGMAVNILRGVVRACSGEVLQHLLEAGRARGLGVEGMSRALVQCAHGDAQLMEKVSQLISLQW